MSAITKLPCEVITSVLRDLGNVRLLLPSLLTCRYFYSCFKENPGVAADILQQQVTPSLVPYAVSVLEAQRLNPLRTGAAVREVLETLYTEPSKLADRLRTMPVPLLTRLGNTHEVIHNLATQFSSSTWTHISNDQCRGSRVSGNLSLSSAEYFRFCRAFYRIELYFSLLRGSTASTESLFHESEKQWFFSRHPPWENEQLGCSLDFLELKLSEASHDILAHDVELGELEIDYLTAGDNGWRQLWLSQGVAFIYRLMNETSYDAKKALLKSTFSAGQANLYDALITPSEENLDDDTPLVEYTDEDLATLFPASDGQDADKGPFEGWRVAFNIWPRSAWVMLINNAGLRERAYVFWDHDRLERYGMLELFENVPEDSALQRADEDFHDMYSSFEERSKIWQKGGSGYWSRGDESRIVWPKEQGRT